MKVLRNFLESARNFYLQITAVFLIVLTILTIYWQDLSILFNEAFRSEAVGHIFLVPFIVAYLIYRKRELVEASFQLEKLKGKTKLVSVNDIVGVAFCLTAFLLYWYGSYTFYSLEYHIASLIIFIAGATLILTNLKTLLILVFPIVFLAFLVPPPSTVVYTAAGFLASVNTQGSYTLLRTIGLPVSLSYNYGAPIIALNTSTNVIEFAVYQASSGLYSLLAFTMFATFLVYIARGSLTRKTALFAIGLLILPIINIIRISIIVFTAYWMGEEIAMNLFHTFTGWLLIFSGMLLLLLIGEKFLHLKILESSQELSSCSKCNDRIQKQELFCLSCGKLLKTQRIRISKRFWIKVMILLVGSFLVSVSIQAPVFAFAPRLIVPGSDPQAIVNVFPNITDYRFQFLFRDEAYEKVAGQDVSLVYGYLPQNNSTLPIYVIVGVANSISNLHNWEVSLIAWQTSRGLPPLVSLITRGDVQLTENPRIIAQYLVFEHPSNYTYVALYWYQTGFFKTGLTVEPRYIRINLLVLTTNSNQSPELIPKLQTLGQSIELNWEPLRIQSLISLGIPVLQFLLGSTVLAVVSAETSQYAFDQKKKRTNLKIFQKYATQDEKILLQTLNDMPKESKKTTNTISTEFERTTGKHIDSDNLIKMLKSLEKSGLLKTDVANVNDRSMLIWKT